MPRASTTTRSIRWSTVTDAKLLDVRMSDMKLNMSRSPVWPRVRRLYDELKSRRIVHRPHVWFSSEWFSPDHIPGIAIPFYLANPRLMKLEERMMLEVEGGSEAHCMRLLRHEAGHTVCTAYRLNLRRRWQQLFGKYSQPYPAAYQPKPYSRNYVVHFDWWYAQAHPAEDFAETFAVWLRPGSRWRQEYRGWPALRKLEYVDQLMREIADEQPTVRSRRHIEPVGELKMTLREHYQRRRRQLSDEWPEFFDRELRRVFSESTRFARRETAAAFLRRMRPSIREVVAEWTGVPSYTIDQVLRDMIDRCKELKLRVKLTRKEAELHAMLMVTVQTMVYLHRGHYKIAL